VDGKPFMYLNVPVATLKACVRASLQELKEPVWFACDVGADLDAETGVLVKDLYQPWAGYGVEDPAMNKATRLSYRQSLPTHAMTFTGFDEEEGRIVKWRVENSWGDNEEDKNLPGKSGKGFLAMEDAWFDEYVYEVVVPLELIPGDVRERAARRDAVPLPLWDPMGSVAR
jgi:bleomycin hydrolase